MPTIGADSAGKVIKNLRQIMFPEERLSDIMYLKHAKDMFERLRKINLSIMPGGK